MSNYRATYVLERESEDGTYEVLMSVSHDQAADDAPTAHRELLEDLSHKIEKYAPMLAASEEEPDHHSTTPDDVPNAPTIRSVQEKE